MDAPVPDAVTLEADRVEWRAGVATAEGHVVVVFGDHRLAGARASWDGAILHVEAGTYLRPDGSFAFDRAEVRPRAGTAVVVGARVETGEARIEADTLAVGETWSARGATVTPCRCADGGPAPLSFTAGRIEVVPDEVILLYGGVVRVFQVPVLPVPYARVPLEPRRFRLLLPELSWGAQGPGAAVAGRFGVGETFVTLGPAWRADVGLRGEAAVTAPAARGEGALGWDAEARAVRGAVSSRGGFDAAARVAWDVAWLSDARYDEDYDVDYVARGVAWRESRAVASAFDGALALDGWLPDDGSAGALARLRGAPTFVAGPLRVTPRLGLDATGAPNGPVVPVAEAGVGVAVARASEWLQVEARADVAGRAALREDGGGGASALVAPPAQAWGDRFATGPLARWGEGGTGLTGDMAMGAAVPLWSTLGPARLQWWPGARGEIRATLDADGARTFRQRAGPAARVATAFASGTVAVDAALLHDGSAFSPALALDVATGRLAMRAQATPELQGGELRWMPGALTLAAGTARADAFWLAWGDAGVAYKRLRVGGGAAWSVDEGALSGADARLGYDDGCAAATLTARFAPDRPLPDVGLVATFRR